MTKPTLVLYTAETCGACERFLSKSWEDTKKKVAPYVKESKHFSQPTMKPGEFDSKCPQGLKNEITYFPTIFLVRSADFSNLNQETVTWEKFPIQEKKDLVEWVKEMSTRENLTNATVSRPLPPPGVQQKQSIPQAIPAPTPEVQKPKKMLPTIGNNGQITSCNSAYKIRNQ
jgi:hypothetical protein